MSARIVTKIETDIQTGARRGAANRQFWRDEDGSLIIFSLFLLIMMLMIAGMSVDLMRSETHRARLQATLDRAVLAGASLEQTLNSEEVVQDYFDKAGLGQFVTAINVTETPTAKTVNASAEMSVNSYFMNMLGVNSLQAPAGGQAEESISDVEISLVLDVSGSMRWNSASGNSKINELKVAAKDFVYLMQCDPDAEKPFDNVCVVEDNTISINLVPYNEQVLLGEDLIQQFNVTEEHTDSSCVDFQAGDFNAVPVELDPQVLDPLALPDPTPNLRRSATIDPWTRHYRHVHENNRTCKSDMDRAVRIYENDYTDLEDEIDLLYAKGYTSIELGMKWGAALLDPAFRPALTNLITNYGMVDPAFNGRPFSYTRARTQKVIVLMTDGINTTQHIVKDEFKEGLSPFWVEYGNPGNPDADNDRLSIYRQDRDDAGLKPYYRVGGNYFAWTPYGGSDAEQMTWQEFWDIYQWDVYTDYGTSSRGNLPDAVEKVQNAEKNARLDAICDAAKAEGILVFTIGFETTAASSAVMASCASSLSHHYDATGLNIREVFASIAREIHELRLTN